VVGVPTLAPDNPIVGSVSTWLIGIAKHTDLTPEAVAVLKQLTGSAAFSVWNASRSTALPSDSSWCTDDSHPCVALASGAVPIKLPEVLGGGSHPSAVAAIENALVNVLFRGADALSEMAELRCELANLLPGNSEDCASINLLLVVGLTLGIALLCLSAVLAGVLLRNTSLRNRVVLLEVTTHEEDAVQVSAFKVQRNLTRMQDLYLHLAKWLPCVDVAPFLQLLQEVRDSIDDSKELHAPKLENLATSSQVDGDTLAWLFSEGLFTGIVSIDEAPGEPCLSEKVRGPPGVTWTTTEESPKEVKSPRPRPPSLGHLDAPSLLTPRGGPLDSLEEKPALREALAQSTFWAFDAAELNAACHGHPVLTLGIYLIRTHGLISRLNLQVDKLQALLTAIEVSYHSHPFHNSCHAADVAQAMNFFVTKFKSALSDTELLAALIAALAHDMDHPATTNTFLTTTWAPLALEYNDRSVLENHHARLLFEILKRPECNILSNLSSANRSEFRRVVIECVMGTDLAVGFDVIGQFRQQFPEPVGEWSSLRSGEGTNLKRILLLKMCLKCADLSHAARTFDIHERNSLRLQMEFHEQGDKERALGHTPAPFMDRTAPSTFAKIQMDFFDFIVLPMWRPFHEIMDLRECWENVANNRRCWEKQLEQTQPSAPQLSRPAPQQSSRSLLPVHPPSPTLAKPMSSHAPPKPLVRANTLTSSRMRAAAWSTVAANRLSKGAGLLSPIQFGVPQLTPLSAASPALLSLSSSSHDLLASSSSRSNSHTNLLDSSILPPIFQAGMQPRRANSLAHGSFRHLAAVVEARED